MPAQSGLGIDKVILAMHVKTLVAVGSVAIVIEAVVDTLCEEAHVTILHIGKGIPVGGDMVRALDEDALVALVGIGVVIGVFAIGQHLLTQLLVGHIGEVTEVIAFEVLERCSADDIPMLILIVGIPCDAVSVLCKAFLAHEIGLLELAAVGMIEVGESKLLQLVLIAELIIVAVPVGIVHGGCCGPVLRGLVHHIQQVVVLPEVVGCLVPQATVCHLVTLHGPTSVPVGNEVLIQRIELAQASLVHIAIGLDAGVGVQAIVTIACRNAAPGLTRLLIVAYVLVAQLQCTVVVEPGESAIVAA